MAKRRKSAAGFLSEEDRKLFIEAVERLPLHTKDKWVEIESKPIAAKKKKNKPDAAVDLHGLTKREAGLRLKTFINRCVFLGHVQVLVIHGKGSGVLRTEVRRLLSENDLVVQITETKARQGGEGAVIAQLRKRK